MNYIEVLDEVILPYLEQTLRPNLEQILHPTYAQNLEQWDSLVINKRKPYTYRAFMSYLYQGVDLRVCLHRFEPCGPDECFVHPHPWPGGFIMLAGEYVHRIGYSPDLDSEPTMLFEEIVRPYSMYEITNKQTWHSVQPLKRCYTIMLNGPPWEEQHSHTRTTKGKDLDKFTESELTNHLSVFWELVSCYRIDKGVTMSL
jgi:hypothetical protein